MRVGFRWLRPVHLVWPIAKIREQPIIILYEPEGSHNYPNQQSSNHPSPYHLNTTRRNLILLQLPIHNTRIHQNEFLKSNDRVTDHKCMRTFDTKPHPSSRPIINVLISHYFMLTFSNTSTWIGLCVTWNERSHYVDYSDMIRIYIDIAFISEYVCDLNWNHIASSLTRSHRHCHIVLICDRQKITDPHSGANSQIVHHLENAGNSIGVHTSCIMMCDSWACERTVECMWISVMKLPDWIYSEHSVLTLSNQPEWIIVRR